MPMVLMVGPGCRPVNHDPVLLIGDDGYRSHWASKPLTTTQMRMGVGSLPTITQKNLK